MAKRSGGICDSRCQMLQKVIVKKENDIRIRWFLKNEQRLIENLGSAKLVTRGKAIIAAREEERKKRKAEPSAKPQKLPGPSVVPSWRHPRTDGSVNIDVMQPIEPEIRSIMYEKNIESFIAANNYLLARRKKPPENRFYFPDCSSWIYGWRLNDYPPIPISKVGLKATMQAEFYQRIASSLDRDPEWYRSCRTRNAKSFNDQLTY